MIDANDVKMPEQRENSETLKNDEEQVRKIEELLLLVNEEKAEQRLRLGEEYYRRFSWFGAGNDESRGSKSFYSYQQEAVHDFIFNLNKSGILSDQVGMGKTIEAGMIISELASRNELHSLLIVVPNELMVAKWEDELSKKFGIRDHSVPEKGIKFPGVKSIIDYDDFCRCVFDCMADEKLGGINEHKFRHTYTEGMGDSYEEVIKLFVQQDIAFAVDQINECLEISENLSDISVDFDGDTFRINGTKSRYRRKYVYDAGHYDKTTGRTVHEVDKFLKSRRSNRPTAAMINNDRFTDAYQAIIRQELNGLFTLLGQYFTSVPGELAGVAMSMTKRYPILVIHNAVAKSENGKEENTTFLNHPLASSFEDYTHQYVERDENGNMTDHFEEYRIIDFFIDVGYQTLIVDEVHDYIGDSRRIPRQDYHNNLRVGQDPFPSKKYDRYELFDDYYFIEKQGLYKKLKSLADKANRKIFLTATPIKSDMIDFYLLTLIASNKDSDTYRMLRGELKKIPKAEERNRLILELYEALVACLNAGDVVGYFCDNRQHFWEETVKASTGQSAANRKKRYKYPYFGNTYLIQNATSPDRIKDYLINYVRYMSMEEIALELIIAYMAECTDISRSAVGIRYIIDALCTLLNGGKSDLQTRVVFRSLLNNTVKMRFEEDFSPKENGGKPIRRIRELLALENGPRLWNKAYQKYGIRHTRHQTYDLSGCKDFDKIRADKVERYRNLPTWPRRDGRVIFLLRDDIFFDNFLQIRRELPKRAEKKITPRDLPNSERIYTDEEDDDPVLKERRENFEKQFGNAEAIFKYIDDSMSGGDANHDPQSVRYDSVDLGDDEMADYKLALVTRLMLGRDESLGTVKNKVLLFAENDRARILEWFQYMELFPQTEQMQELDAARLEQFKEQWSHYGVERPRNWAVSEDCNSLQTISGNVLIIIDPTKYAQGIDLQKADTIINFDIDYDPLKMEQRIGRIDRIRPSGQSQNINIISFVPYNNMSGFVINFFANEMKMFTQWMGETTGIVSVPEEEGSVAEGVKDSFGARVKALEEYYLRLYRLCTEDVDEDTLTEFVDSFSTYFNRPRHETQVDFEALQKLRGAFDTAFRNSISLRRSGFSVAGGEPVMRFNSTMHIASQCPSSVCASCPDFHRGCSLPNKEKTNDFGKFKDAVKTFFDEGSKFYEERRSYFASREEVIFGNDDAGKQIFLDFLLNQATQFQSEKKQTAERLKKLGGNNAGTPFTVPFEQYLELFEPIKKLYWDNVVQKYLALILDKFYRQCDTVLESSRLFERFIKTFSIAELMNNMEGSAS